MYNFVDSLMPGSQAYYTLSILDILEQFRVSVCVGWEVWWFSIHIGIDIVENTVDIWNKDKVGAKNNQTFQKSKALAKKDQNTLDIIYFLSYYNIYFELLATYIISYLYALRK